MPKIYRSMKEDDGKPLLGQASNTLGVRPEIDIVPADGMVKPKTGGMSVSPSLYALPPGMIPKRLKYLLPEAEGAKGSNSLSVWKMGTGLFQDAPLALKLALRQDKPTHGLVEPDAVMPFQEYEIALQNTRNEWEKDESGAQP